MHKPAGIPSAPLNLFDRSVTAVSLTADMFPEILEIRGRRENEYGILHRLDTATAGLLLFARTQKAYDFLNVIQEEGYLVKEYTALCRSGDGDGLPEGFPPLPPEYEGWRSRLPFTVRSAFRAYGPGRREVRPVPVFSACRKKYSPRIYGTDILTLDTSGPDFIINCSLYKGARHQVRCHLAWCGMPFKGDSLYNMSYRGSSLPSKLYFEATGISFPHPVSGKHFSCRINASFTDMNTEPTISIL